VWRWLRLALSLVVLVPAWATDLSADPPLLNARAEPVASKPAFRAAFAGRRCLIPADGFYEWVAAPGKKQPIHFRMRQGGPFAFAGLWERWQPKGACRPWNPAPS
jgi:putative SOS response-associated peptidase YedK